MKKHLVRYLLGAACLLLFVGHGAKFWQLPFFSVLDGYLYDVRVRMSTPGGKDERIVIVDLDEKSLAEIGRWPWGRDVVAELVRKLTDDYKVAIVGFDVVFAEPDESSGLKVLERLAKDQLRGERTFQDALPGLRVSLNYDQLFAETLKGRPVVLGYYFSGIEDARRSGALPAPVWPAGQFGSRPEMILDWKGYGGNLLELQKNAASAGHFNPIVDFDGVSRRVPLIVRHEGVYYEALALAMVRLLHGGAPVRPGFPEGKGTIEWLDVGNDSSVLRIPVDEFCAALIPYRGGERSFPYVSAADVLKGRIDPAALKGRAILIGTTAPGLMDLRSTPVGATYPGVEIHANMIAGIMDGTLRQRPSYVLGAEVVELVLVGAALTLLLPLLSPLRASLLTAGALTVVVALNLFLWYGAGMVLPLASVILLCLLLYALNMSWGYFVESKSKRQFTELFGQYVPPELVDEMARDPERYSMEGRKQELTVLFSDVRDFTTISESLDPRELSQLMNEYLGAMTAVTRKYRGTVDKYIGDAIMAFWGAPVTDPEHARNAVLTALDMQREMKNLRDPFVARGWPELHIGIGINTGMMTVGDMGSPVRKAYTVMGDAVNTGSRLEGLTKEYGVPILVGETTKAAVKDMVFREIDRVRPKGKGEPLAIYEPVGIAGEVPGDLQDELKLWQHALRLYRSQDWDQAELQLHNLSRRAPDRALYRIYIERIAYLRNDPPGPGWDGVRIFKTK